MSALQHHSEAEEQNQRQPIRNAGSLLPEELKKCPIDRIALYALAEYESFEQDDQAYRRQRFMLCFSHIVVEARKKEYLHLFADSIAYLHSEAQILERSLKGFYELAL